MGTLKMGNFSTDHVKACATNCVVYYNRSKEWETTGMFLNQLRVLYMKTNALTAVNTFFYFI